MTSRTPVRPSEEDRRARAAVAALFFTNGAVFANLVPRYPEIKTALDLDNASYGLAVAAFPIGAIVAGLASATLIRRFGSGAVAAAGMILTSLGVLMAGMAPSVGLFAAGLFLGGAMDAITDVAQNAHGLRVQRRYGRSIINGFHATWSIGAVVGGSMAAAAIAAHLPLGIHLGISAAIFAVVSLIALRFCLPDADDAADEDAVADRDEIEASLRAGVSPQVVTTIVALVLIAIAGTLVEDSGNSWASLYLSGSLGAPAVAAASGYIALVGAQFVGRLIGDRLVDRFGQCAVVRAGGLIVAVGMGLALAVPSVLGTILGFAAAGFGVASFVPAAMHEADRLPGLRRGTGLTMVSWLMRLGFLFSPPVVGFIADHAGLRTGLLVVPAAGALVVLLAGVLRGRRDPIDRMADRA
ncbi:MAG: MFS transporter [Actinomyces sp.]|jgi:MFS family permease|nr:MFS transporter [Actinomyces sp.]MCI1642121.1 MFS transporter [Actinomyces sp.]MCI1662425.1 MFS transporter [Actinomyces sp.]MCI1691219.1 MFS transporter [Actinomyces sp.]MCI1788093.1 MFS transporter [Actinomyces sp.]MCI1830486.1 MFS transporter [Actinomyces sp.]